MANQFEKLATIQALANGPYTREFRDSKKIIDEKENSDTQQIVPQSTIPQIAPKKTNWNEFFIALGAIATIIIGVLAYRKLSRLISEYEYFEDTKE